MQKENPKLDISISYKDLILAFKKLGLKVDVETRWVVVLRLSGFPFQRITVPKDDKISAELLKLYARDLKINFSDFFLLINQ